MSLIQALFGPIYAMFGTNYVNSPEDMWTMRAIAISSLVAWLAAVIGLWRFSNKIADKLTGTQNSSSDAEHVDFPFDVGVGLAGLVFLVEGLKGLSGEAAAWYFSRSDTFPFVRPSGVVDVRHLAVYSAEAVFGAILFVGAKSILTGIMRLRGMPQPAEDEDAV